LAGCEAAGIRLREGADYPYFEVQGFPACFLKTENHLCALDEKGAPVRDADGNPVLECMCGNVLQGRFNPSLPFFTPRGSFWTGSTTDLLASTTEADRQGRTRNRCHGEGYESVALVPLRCGTEIFGLLQLNDKERGRFTAETVALVEQMAATIAGVLVERRTKEALRESEERYQALFGTMLEGFAYCQMLYDEDGRPVDWVYLAVNSAFGTLTGLTDVVGKRVTEAIPGIKAASPELFDIYGRVASTGSAERFEINFTPLSKWLDVAVSSPIKGYFVAVFEDITERKHTEEQLARSEEHFRALMENSSDLVAVIDGAGIFQFQSPSSDPVLGYRPEELVGRSAFDFIHPDDTGPAQRSLTELLQGRRDPSQSTELRFPHKSGSWRALEVKARKLPGQAGEFSYVLNSRDVTERRQTQDELRLTQLSVNCAAEQIHWIDPEGRILFANEASCQRDGYSREEMLSLRIFDLDPTFTPELWREAWQSTKKAGSRTFEAVHRTKEGELYPIEVSANHVEQNGREYDFAFVRDISERKQAEQSLRASEQRYHTLFSSADDGIILHELEGRILEANTVVCERVGYANEELVGMNVTDIRAPEASAAYSKHMNEVRRRGRAIFETTHLRRDRSTIPVEVSSRLVEDAGREVVLSISRDVTERKRAEEALERSQQRLRLHFEQTPLAVIEFDLGGHVVEWNPAAETIFGFSRAEAVGRFWTFIVPEATWPQLDGVWESLVSLKGGLRSSNDNVRKDGRIIQCEWYNTPLVGADGKSVGVASLVMDITERVEAERALRESDEQLRQAQKMEAVGQLAGGIAHDFNNLLTAIIGNSSLALAAMAPEDPNRELIADVQEVGERAAGLTRQILAYSRRQILKPEVRCLNEIALGIEPLLRRTLGEPYDLHFSLAPDLGQTEVDPHQMEQVLMNLALNARDAMPEGGHLTVETANVRLDRKYARIHPEVEPGRYVMLAVSDTGCGMDEHTTSRIFEPFFTTKEVGKGTGLGLSTVFGIVKQSGGSVSVYSEPGRGSTFKVYLPVSETAVALEADSPLRWQTKSGSETILVVEDEASVRELVVRILSRSGYEVLEAGSALEVGAVLKKAGSVPHLLLTDVVLPGGGSGREVAEALVARYPNLPVIFMSGYTRDSVVHNGRLDHGIEFLEKPFAPEVLLEKVRAVLDAPTKRTRQPAKSGSS